MKTPLQLRDILEAAIEIQNREERNEFLNNVCGNNNVLKGKIKLLVDEYFEANSIINADIQLTQSSDLNDHSTINSFESDTPIHSGKVERTETDLAGSLVGPFLLTRLLGQGGFGVVYAAEQQHPVRRTVAVKLIKPGMDSKQVLARFELERQSLAVMDHPSIATILDAGKTQQDRPYFAMELVSGIPITQYCDQKKLNVHERLKLFVKLCDAIHHAHQKGVIHRDLKPSNILVEELEGTPLPKVIDFGIAKATTSRLSTERNYTRFGQVMGTPLYMSPEQASKSGNADIDARSDIYSLGVLLFELLAGIPPISNLKLNEIGFDEVCRLIGNEDAPTLSRFVAESNRLNEVAEMRSSDPRQLVRTIRGDLDWITQKALDRERDRRYDSASALGKDILRFLSNDPIDACPPSKTYRIKKFCQKFRTPLITATAILLILFASTISSATLAYWAVRAKEQAEQNEAKASEEKSQKEQALQLKDLALGEKEAALEKLGLAIQAETQAKEREITERKNAEYVLSCILMTFLPIAKDEPPSIEVFATKAKMALVRGKNIPPLTQASIAYAIGRMYMSRDDFRNGLSMMSIAVKQRKEVLGNDHSQTGEAQAALATCLLRLGQVDQSTDVFRQAINARETKTQIAMIPLIEPKSIDEELAYLTSLVEVEKYDIAERLTIELLDLCKNPAPINLEKVTKLNLVLADLYLNTGRIEKAKTIASQTLTTAFNQFGPKNPIVIQAYKTISRQKYRIGETSGAISHFLAAILQKANSSNPPQIHNWIEIKEFCRLCVDCGEYELARMFVKPLVEVATKRSRFTKFTIDCLSLDGEISMLMGDTNAARTSIAKAFNATPFLCESHSDRTARIRFQLAELNLIDERYEDILSLYPAFGPGRLAINTRWQLRAKAVVGEAKSCMGETQQGIQMLEESLSMAVREFGHEHAIALEIQERLLRSSVNAGLTGKYMSLGQSSYVQLRRLIDWVERNSFEPGIRALSIAVEESDRERERQIYAELLRLSDRQKYHQGKVSSDQLKLAYARILIENFRFDEAESTLHSAIAQNASRPLGWPLPAYWKCLGESYLQRANSSENEALQNQHRESAKNMFAKCVDYFDRFSLQLADSNSICLPCVAELVSLSEAQGNRKESAKWNQKREQLLRFDPMRSFKAQSNRRRNRVVPGFDR